MRLYILMFSSTRKPHPPFTTSIPSTMSSHDPPNQPSSSSSSSSVTDTLMNYLTAAMTKSHDAFEHAKNFGRKASEQLSYAAAQAQVQAQRATNYVSGRSSSNDNDLFGSEYGYATANRQTNRDDLSGSRSLSRLPPVPLTGRAQ